MTTAKTIEDILQKDSPANAPKSKEVNDLLTKPAADLGRKIFRDGNTKLGKKIIVWGIPAVASCPGRTALCAGLCYATKNFYLYKESVVSRHINFVIANRPDFADIVSAELKTKKAKVVRIHDSGDFFSLAYTEDWLKVMRDNPDKKFFLFTRSWRVAELGNTLAEMAKLPNTRIWFSIDRETGWPNSLPKNVRLAYMQVDEKDVPTRQIDLVFRDHKVRNSGAVKKVKDALVCPYENGVTRTGDDKPETKAASNFSCSTCGLCWDSLDGNKDPRKYHGKAVKADKRISLTVLAPTI